MTLYQTIQNIAFLVRMKIYQFLVYEPRVKAETATNLKTVLELATYAEVLVPDTPAVCQVQLETMTKRNPDKNIQLTTQPPAATRRQSRANAINTRPGVEDGRAKTAKTPLEAWRLFSDNNNMIDISVKNTNKKLQSTRGRLQRASTNHPRYNDTDRLQIHLSCVRLWPSWTSKSGDPQSA